MASPPSPADYMASALYPRSAAHYISLTPSTAHYMTYAPSMASASSPPYPSSSENHVAPSPYPPFISEYIESWDSDYFYPSLADWLTLACYGWFSFLIGLDVWRAIKKRATWLPGKAFTLTGVTVQIIVWWTSVSHITNQCKKDVGFQDLVVFYQLVLSGKVALCVFIGYLLPGMAAPSVRAFLALGISICVQIASELMIVYSNKYYKTNDDLTTWVIIANFIVFICIIVLGLILACTILASKTVHGLMRQRISAIFPITRKDESQSLNEKTMSISWDDFEDEVLSSWLVARVCQPDYVICRSVFSSAVGIVVTFCVLIFILSNTYFDNYFWRHHIDYNPNPMDYAIFSLLFSFIIIGWIVTCSRWLAVQLYFRSHRQVWRRFLFLEDFWTRNTAELIHMCDLKVDRQRFQDADRQTSMLKKLQRLPITIFTKVRLHKLAYLVLMLQLIVVFFSKLCDFLLEVIMGKLVHWFRKQIRKGNPTAPEKYKKYKRTLELICMPGEDPSDLWEANKMSFNKVKDLIDEGYKKGSSNEEIKSIFTQYSLQWAKDGTELLNMLQTLALPSVSEHFPSVENQYVKTTVVSLFTILIRLRKPNSNRLRKVLKACREVWDLLCFADECDIDLQASEISLFDDLRKDKDQICMAAEKEFYKLQMEYDKLDPGHEESDVPEATNVKQARRIIKSLSKECEDLLRTKNLLEGNEKVPANLKGNEKVAAKLRDSMDWMKIGPNYTLYKLCRFLLDNSKDCAEKEIEDCAGKYIEDGGGEDIKDFVSWTEDALRNVIACCISRLPDMLVNLCWKWAQEFEEDKVWQAIYLAGKCKGMMESWEPKPKLTKNTTKQWTNQGMHSA